MMISVAPYKENGIQPCSQILSHLLTHRPLIELPLLTSATRVLVSKSFFNESESISSLGLSLGKTLFLFFVLALRVLQSLPSIYMVGPKCIYIVDSKGVRKTPTKKFYRNLVTDEHWCLVDSNHDLQTMPTELLELGSFTIQTASPRTKRVEWWKKSPNPCTFFFMKAWSLPELIVGHVS